MLVMIVRRTLAMVGKLLLLLLRLSLSRRVFLFPLKPPGQLRDNSTNDSRVHSYKHDGGECVSARKQADKASEEKMFDIDGGKLIAPWLDMALRNHSNIMWSRVWLSKKGSTPRARTSAQASLTKVYANVMDSATRLALEWGLDPQPDSTAMCIAG